MSINLKAILHGAFPAEAGTPKTEKNKDKIIYLVFNVRHLVFKFLYSYSTAFLNRCQEAEE